MVKKVEGSEKDWKMLEVVVGGGGGKGWRIMRVEDVGCSGRWRRVAESSRKWCKKAESGRKWEKVLKMVASGGEWRRVVESDGE